MRATRAFLPETGAFHSAWKAESGGEFEEKEGPSSRRAGEEKWVACFSLDLEGEREGKKDSMTMRIDERRFEVDFEDDEVFAI